MNKVQTVQDFFTGLLKIVEDWQDSQHVDFKVKFFLASFEGNVSSYGIAEQNWACAE